MSEIDTRKLTQEVRWAHWAEVMRRRSESGQTVRAYCQENQIKEDRYYYWQRRLRAVAGAELCIRQGGALPVVADPGDMPVFVELPSKGQHVPCSAAVRLEAGGITVEIGPGADAGLAEAILRVLLGRC